MTSVTRDLACPLRLHLRHEKNYHDVYVREKDQDQDQDQLR